jgi:hypothetical protein
VKTRLTEEEYADFTANGLRPMVSASPNFSGRPSGALPYAPLLHVSSVNDELLSAVGKLTAEYGRIGGNLNQIARYAERVA